MICCVCGIRFAPIRRDKWIIKDDPFSATFIDDKAKQEYLELFDNDTKCPCAGCSI